MPGTVDSSAIKGLPLKAIGLATHSFMSLSFIFVIHLNTRGLLFSSKKDAIDSILLNKSMKKPGKHIRAFVSLLRLMIALLNIIWKFSLAALLMVITSWPLGMCSIICNWEFIVFVKLIVPNFKVLTFLVIALLFLKAKFSLMILKF